MKIHEYNEMMSWLTRPGKAQGGVIGKGGMFQGEDLGYRTGYAKISKISRDLKQTPTRTDISVEKQKVVDDVLEQLVKEGNTTFEKVSEVIDQIVKKGMGKTTARTGIENSKFLSQFEFLGPGAGLDKEILESDWFKRNYPNATTIEEASGKQPLSKVRNQYKLAKKRGFPLSQKQLADEIGISRNVLRDYISYSRTSKKPENPTDVSRVKRAKEFVNLLKEAGITFSGGGQRYGSSDIRFTANPEQIANLKKSYEEDFLQAFTKEQKKLLDDTVRSTYDDMIKSGNLMKKFELAKLLNTKLGFGSFNAMTRAIDRVLSKKEIDVLPKVEFVSGGEREIKKRKSIEMAGDDANQIRKSQNRFLDIMKSEFKKLSNKNLLQLIKNTPQLLNQVTLRFDKKTGEFFNENIDYLDTDTIRKRSLPNVEHIKKVKEAGIQAEWPYNRQVAVSNINKHIKESVEGFINDKEPLLKRKDIPIETKQKIKNQILNIENKMNEMSLRMFANGKFRGVSEGLSAINRETGVLTSFYENVRSMGLNPETYSGKIPSRFKPFAIAAGLTGGLITAAAANTESPQQASELLGQMPQGSPGQLSEDEGYSLQDIAALGTVAAAGAKPAWKHVIKPVLKTMASPTASIFFSGWNFIDNFNASKAETPEGKVYDALTTGFKFGENQTEAPGSAVGMDMMFPEIAKQTAKKLGVDLSSKMPSLATKKGAQNALTALGKFLWQNKKAIALNPIGRAASFMTPVGLTLNAVALGKQLYTMGVEEQKRFEALSPDEQAAERAEQEEFSRYSAAEGGRVGFDKGSKPKSPGRRAFLKGITALAALPLVGRYFKLGKVLERASTYTGPAIEKIKGMPEWFPGLVKKLWNEGEDVTKKVAYNDRQVVKRGTLESGDDVDLYYQMDTGDVTINVTPKKGTYETGSGAYNKEYSLDYQKGIADETTKGKPADSFGIAEGRPVQVGPDDVDIDYDQFIDVDDALSDLTELEAFSKNKSTTQIHKKKGTKKKDVFPDYDPPEPDYYDID